MSGPRLYYKDDDYTLYHGDCRDLDLAQLGDIIITDPPRGLDHDGVIVPTQVDLTHIFSSRLPAVVWAVPEPRDWHSIVAYILCALEPGDCNTRILDPYAGSGAVVDVAVRFGYRGVAIEIEESLCEAMARRWGDST